MSDIFILGDKNLSIAQIQHIISSEISVALSDEAKKRITDCRDFLDKKNSKI